MRIFRCTAQSIEKFIAEQRKERRRKSLKGMEWDYFYEIVNSHTKKHEMKRSKVQRKYLIKQIKIIS